MCVLLFLFLYSIPSSSNANGIHLDFFFWPVRLTEEKLLFVGDRSKGFSFFCMKRFFHTIHTSSRIRYVPIIVSTYLYVSTTHNMIIQNSYSYLYVVHTSLLLHYTFLVSLIVHQCFCIEYDYILI